ncbi:MAG: hypothetical protein P8Y71_09970 [Pseudolabrys sp.]
MNIARPVCQVHCETPVTISLTCDENVRAYFRMAACYDASEIISQPYNAERVPPNARALHAFGRLKENAKNSRSGGKLSAAFLLLAADFACFSPPGEVARLPAFAKEPAP